MKINNSYCQLNLDSGQYKAELGEGVFFDSQQNILFWVDINNFNLCFINENLEYTHTLPHMVSKILDVEKADVYLLSEVGVICYNFNSREVVILSSIPEKYNNNNYRSNDAVKISKDLYMYGVMRKTPLVGDGALILSIAGSSIVVHKGITIPNSFIRIPKTNSILITDSYAKITFIFDFNKTWSTVLNKKVWLDLSSTSMTPDGGCISSNGRIFIAIWDGFKILELDLNGAIVKEYSVSVPRPTSCVLNLKENILFVTSAYEGLSDFDKERYPESGQIITLDVGK